MMKTLSSPRTQPTSDQSNTNVSSNKVSMPLAITFGIMLFLVACVVIVTKTSLLHKLRTKLRPDSGEDHVVEFENKQFDSSMWSD